MQQVFFQGLPPKFDLINHNKFYESHQVYLHMHLFTCIFKEAKAVKHKNF